MKKLILLSPVLFLLSCGNQSESSVETIVSDTSKKDTVAQIESTPDGRNSEINVLGYYVGAFEADDIKETRSYFYKNKINISIDSIGGTAVKGHSVVAGNNRPFFGTVELKDGVYTIKVLEPGDDKYDGKFEFVLTPATHSIEGIWLANNSKLEVAKRKYKLTQSSFTYDASNEVSPSLIGNVITDWASIAKLGYDSSEEEVITADATKFNASVDKLKKEDIENMYKGDLELIRNAVYARHGYSFKNRKMRYIFDNEVDWYIPVTTDVRNELTTLEKENIKLISRYEEHASRYYDSFGR